jgi:capsule polysaccharide export protein KpsE/RkpR
MSVPRQVLEQAIREGGSVLIEGRIFTRLQDLPSDLELAKGDDDRQAAIIAQMEADLQAKQAELDAVKAQLKQSSTPPASDPKSDLKKRLEGLTKDELLAEVKAAGINLPSEVNTKAEIVAYLVEQDKE